MRLRQQTQACRSTCSWCTTGAGGQAENGACCSALMMPRRDRCIGCSLRPVFRNCVWEMGYPRRLGRRPCWGMENPIQPHRPVSALRIDSSNAERRREMPRAGGSSPSRCTHTRVAERQGTGLQIWLSVVQLHPRVPLLCLHRLAVRTPGFQPGNCGSTPHGDATFTRPRLPLAR